MTLAAPARGVQLNPDGTWEALVPIAPGPNEIRVTAVPHLGVPVERRIELQGGTLGPELDPALLARRGRLLDRVADEVAGLRRLELLAELRREIVEARPRAALATRDPCPL